MEDGYIVERKDAEQVTASPTHSNAKQLSVDVFYLHETWDIEKDLSVFFYFT